MLKHERPIRAGEIMGVTQTSIDSYKATLPHLNDKQDKLYSLFQLYPKNSFSDRELAKLLDWPINTVTPRRGELYTKGLIEPSKIEWDHVTKRRVQKWKIKTQ